MELESDKSMLFDHTRIKLEINKRKKSEKYPCIQKLNSAFLNSPQLNEEITKNTRKYFELNESKIITCQNSSGASKTVLRRQFIALNNTTQKRLKKRSQISNLSFRVKNVEKAQ